MDTVPVFVLRADTLKKTVELPGELIPYEQTDLYAKVSGFVRTMKVDIGDRVHKGQTLAVIEAPEINTQFVQAESAIQSAKAKWVASKDNFDRLFRASQSPSPGIVAPVDLERSRNQEIADSASYEAVRQQAKAYKEVSGYLYITAPFDGVVTTRKADPGALVGSNAMLLTVQNNNKLRLRIAVPEMYVSSASAARKVQFSVDAYPERVFTGVLTRKTETVDPATRTELWEYGVDNSNHLLKAGVFANSRISIERSGPSFIIPVSAIATTLEKKFVIKVTQGKADWIDIRQGINTDSGMEVFGKLAPGDTLLVKGTDERKPGTTAYWKIIPANNLR
ncbi:MAG: efflux RND transporter periplasmic adaptor subunit [Bacteroidota bacterium]|nr:efflux RND transporter periplasmic adaptor subunit [Bacteroidota bacterium]MDP4247285.1 efflux RND transporter periplasmic adaptor subunit [Bacteroidota bacterium]MDP4252367.1 efflux RND transporter periplasmic adaptor subunit [Bacteroidota bacterium]MDP4257924.1 efflux RND transporter periplasmic adaptor subunit [Bacteroidota bacterium]